MIFVVTFFNHQKNEAATQYYNEVTNSCEKDILAFCNEPKTRREIAEYLGIKTLFYVMEKYIQPLIDKGLLKMTIPDKPKSKNQKFFTIK